MFCILSINDRNVGKQVTRKYSIVIHVAASAIICLENRWFCSQLLHFHTCVLTNVVLPSSVRWIMKIKTITDRCTTRSKISLFIFRFKINLFDTNYRGQMLQYTSKSTVYERMLFPSVQAIVVINTTYRQITIC